MDDTMKDEKDEKGLNKKKGVVVVIALGGKPPKSPMHTADPDEKKKHDTAINDAWRYLSKEEIPIGGEEHWRAVQAEKLRQAREREEYMANAPDIPIEKPTWPPASLMCKKCGKGPMMTDNCTKCGNSMRSTYTYPAA